MVASTRCENDIKIINECKTVNKNAMVVNKYARTIIVMMDGIFGGFICECNE